MHAPCLEALSLVCVDMKHFDVENFARRTSLKSVAVDTEVSKGRALFAFSDLKAVPDCWALPCRLIWPP